MSDVYSRIRWDIVLIVENCCIRTCSSTETFLTFQRNSSIAKTNATATPIPKTKKTPPTFDRASSFDDSPASSSSSFKVTILRRFYYIECNSNLPDKDFSDSILPTTSF